MKRENSVEYLPESIIIDIQPESVIDLIDNLMVYKDVRKHIANTFEYDEYIELKDEKKKKDLLKEHITEYYNLGDLLELFEYENISDYIEYDNVLDYLNKEYYRADVIDLLDVILSVKNMDIYKIIDYIISDEDYVEYIKDKLEKKEKKENNININDIDNYDKNNIEQIKNAIISDILKHFSKMNDQYNKTKDEILNDIFKSFKIK